jgi:hypothetical protein
MREDMKRVAAVSAPLARSISGSITIALRVPGETFLPLASVASAKRMTASSNGKASFGTSAVIGGGTGV